MSMRFVYARSGSIDAPSHFAQLELAPASVIFLRFCSHSSTKWILATLIDCLVPPRLLAFFLRGDSGEAGGGQSGSDGD